MALSSYRQDFLKLQKFTEAFDKAQVNDNESTESLPAELRMQPKISRDDVIYYASKIQGSIVFPKMPGYELETGETAVTAALPQIIIFCSTPEDVRTALEIASKYGYRVACRSGGHSTAGFSVNDGMVLDVSRMNDVLVDPKKKQMTVGAGAQAGKINSVLNTYQLHVPGGGCNTVGIAGYMQGGGYGFTSREYGMNCDNVLSVTVMLANRKVVIASKSRNQDLFWAIRGGTGGNFGVLINITYRLQNLYKVWGFALKWDLEAAPEALLELQTNYMKRSASPYVNYLAVFASVKNEYSQQREPCLVMLGMFHGSPEEGRKAIDSLLRLQGTEYIMERTAPYAELNDALLEILNPPENVPLNRLKRCGYIEKPLSLQSCQEIARFFATTPNAFNMMVIEPYGGAINKYPVKASAFIHRKVDMDFYCNSYYDDAGAITNEQKAKEWFNQFEQLMKNHYNDFRYQNYPALGFTNFRWAYWGDAFNSLLFVKKKFDPDEFFRFDQWVSPYPYGGAVKRSDAGSMFNDPYIDYEEFS